MIGLSDWNALEKTESKRIDDRNFILEMVKNRKLKKFVMSEWHDRVPLWQGCAQTHDIR